MAGKWEKTNYPGIRFREHDTRKNGIKKDQYFILSYRLNGKRKDEAVGWSTKGWTAKKANALLSEILENQRTGSGPQTLAEMRGIETDRREAEQEKILQEVEDRKTFSEFFNETYLPSASKHKKKYTIENEQSLFKNWLNPEIGHLPFNKIKPFNLEKLNNHRLKAGGFKLAD